MKLSRVFIVLFEFLRTNYDNEDKKWTTQWYTCTMLQFSYIFLGTFLQHPCIQQEQCSQIKNIYEKYSKHIHALKNTCQHNFNQMNYKYCMSAHTTTLECHNNKKKTMYAT